MNTTYFSQPRGGHLVDVLDWASSEHGSEAVCFPAQYRRETYESLADQSRDIAGGLIHHGVKPGQVVGILFSNCPNFITSYFAVLRAGGVVVPLPGPMTTERLDDYLTRLRTIIEDAPIEYLVLENAFAPFMTRCLADEPITVLPIDHLFGTGTAAPDVAISPDAVAMVQYVAMDAVHAHRKPLSHRRLLQRVCAVCQGNELSPDDINGQWLPLFHDMGLVGMLAAMSSGMTQYVWPPLFFIKDPAGWLQEFVTASSAASRRLGQMVFDPEDSKARARCYRSQRRHSML